jgi:hypothetical protein
MIEQTNQDKVDAPSSNKRARSDESKLESAEEPIVEKETLIRPGSRCKAREQNEVVEMEKAMDLVNRCKERERNGGQLKPRGCRKKQKSIEEVDSRTCHQIQEAKDYAKLNQIRQLLRQGGCRVYPNVLALYDQEICGYRLVNNQ